MADYSCHNCVYSHCDSALWLRCAWAGKPLLPRCANHPQWPGRMHDVPGVPCRNHRSKPVLPMGDDVRLIPLGDGLYAYVDAADYEWLSQWRWHMSGTGYAGRNEKGKTILMHRQIMRPPKGKAVDHTDGNRAHNCRRNLRLCNPRDNQRNRRKRAGSVSRFIGVSYDKWSDKWCTRCQYGGTYHNVGRFDLEVDAARAYDRAAVLHVGEFARLNFPEEWPPERRAQLRAEQAGAEKKGKNARSRRAKSSSAGTPATRRPARDKKSGRKKGKSRRTTKGSTKRRKKKNP